MLVGGTAEVQVRDACTLTITILETSIFPVLILKYLNLKNNSANFDENRKINSKEVLTNEINGLLNSVKFSRSYDDVYLGVIFLDTGYISSLLVCKCEKFCLSCIGVSVPDFKNLTQRGVI